MTATLPESAHASAVRVTRSALLDALSRVGLVAKRGGGNSLPVLQSVLVASDGDGLRFTATDFDRTVSVVAPADGALDFPTRLLPCHRLLAIVAQLPEGTVTIAPRKGDQHGVRITADKARFDVAGLSPDEFPAYGCEQPGNATSLAVDAAAFVLALSRCSTCCSYAVDGSALAGVHVKAEKDQALYLEATDRYQMAREWVERASGPALDIVIPGASVPIIAKLFADAERLTVSVAGLQAVLTADESTRFDTRLIENVFPDTSPFFRNPQPHEAAIDRATFLAAVKRVAALSSDEKFLVRLNWNSDHVVVSGFGDDDAGRSEDTVPCELHGNAPIRIAFSTRLLIHALSLRTAETIRLGLKNAETMMTLRDDGAKAAQGLVMPRRDLGD